MTHADAGSAPQLAAVAEALRGHPTLRCLSLGLSGRFSEGAQLAEAAEAIAGLVAANSPALRRLSSIDDSSFLDLRGQAAVYRALRSNTHLESFSFYQTLNCYGRPEKPDERFAREHILPAACGRAPPSAACTGTSRAAGRRLSVTSRRCWRSAFRRGASSRRRRRRRRKQAAAAAAAGHLVVSVRLALSKCGARQASPGGGGAKTMKAVGGLERARKRRCSRLG